MNQEFNLFLKDFKLLLSSYGVCLYKDTYEHYNEEECKEEQSEIIKISGCGECISLEELYERLYC